jgi:peroxiredoxin
MLIVAASFLFAACSGLGVAASRTPDSAPDFELELFGNQDYTKGEKVSLSQFQGQPVVINFWYPSCPPCRLEMPDLEAAYQRHKDDGVKFIGVQLLGLDSVGDGQDFIDDFGVNYAVGPDRDSGIVIDYKVVGFPTTFFLDKRHEVVRSWAGALTGEKLEELIQELLQ